MPRECLAIATKGEKMKLTYLGTSAAEATPAPFCDCDICEHARREGGKNVRTRSQALLDGKILIDFPPDTLMHTLSEGLRLSRLDACILTHTHHDHFAPDDMFFRTQVAAHMKEEKPLHFFCRKDGIKILEGRPASAKCIQQGGLIPHEITPFTPFTVGEYKITPLNANHCPLAVIYLIEKGDKAILYANDTGLFPEDTLEYLKTAGVKLDLVSYDCTYGTWHRGNLGHLDLPEDIITRDTLGSLGLLKSGCRHVITHISHNNGGHTHDSLSAVAEAEGFTLAYDGLTVEI